MKAITPAGDGRVVIEHTFDDGTVVRLAAILVPLKPHEQRRELQHGGKAL